MKILVADDDPTSRLIVQTALRNLGHECDTATNGTQAWDAFRSQQPDVVISDWMMPGLTGLQLCRNIRDHNSGGYVYFVMVSGQGLLDELRQRSIGIAATHMSASWLMMNPTSHGNAFCMKP